MASMLDACRANQGLPAKLTAGSRVGYDLSKVGAGASRGFSGKKKLEAAPWSNTWPAPGSSLDLDFANNRGFVRGVGQGGVMDAITFTRASNATYVGEDGLLKGYTQAGNNLLSFPQDFDNAAWGKTNVTVNVNAAAAPDGTLTADQVTPSTAGPQYVQQTNPSSAGQTCTFTVYAKQNGFNWLFVQEMNGGPGKTFDLQNGVVGTYTFGTVISSSISDAGNGWWRCSVTAVTPGLGSVRIWVVAGDNITAVTPDGTSGIFIWGAQLEVGSTATEYFPTNIGVPRFDWASTEQVARRNLLTNTDSFASYSLGDVTRTYPAAGQVAPNGKDTVALFTETATTGFHEAASGWATSGANRRFVYSVYAKYNGAHLLLMFSSGTSTEFANFDLQNGVVGPASANANANIEDVGNGWFRVSVSPILPVSGQLWLQLQRSPAAVRNTKYAGDGASGVYVWGVQFEEGTVATDYTPVAQSTTSSPLRSAPTCNGLLIEEARTNRLLWCRDATQTQWVKTDITAAKDQTGIDGVANAASSLTATADGGTCIQTITLASGSRTGSVYLKRLTGTGTVQVSLDGSTWSTVDLSAGEWRRIVLSGTVVNPVVAVRLAVSGDAVAMDFGQVEDGAFATTPILTTTATATRSQDSPDMRDGAFFNWYNQSGGTFASVSQLPTFSAGGSVIYTIAALDNVNQFYVWRNSLTNIRADSAANPGGTSVINFPFSLSSDRALRTAYRVKNYNFALANNGAVSANSVYTINPRMRALLLGRAFNGGSYSNACITRLTFFPASYSDVAVQGLSV